MGVQTIVHLLRHAEVHNPQGEHNGRSKKLGVENANSGGHILLVGPTTLLLYKQYGLEGGVLSPVYQRTNGTQKQERFRAVVNFSSWT